MPSLKATSPTSFESQGAKFFNRALGAPYFGRGIDGDVVVSATTKNINTDILGTASFGRSVDAPYTSVTAISGTSLTVGSTTDFKDGDICVIINMQGSAGNYSNVGNYELVKISGAPGGGIITIASALTQTYGAVSNASLTGQKVVIQRIPEYNSVSVQDSGIITCDAWDGTKGGIVAFLSIDLECTGDGPSTIGKIDVTGLGYRGGSVSGGQGEGINAGRNTVSTSSNQGAGGGGGLGQAGADGTDGGGGPNSGGGGGAGGGGSGGPGGGGGYGLAGTGFGAGPDGGPGGNGAAGEGSGGGTGGAGGEGGSEGGQGSTTGNANLSIKLLLGSGGGASHDGTLGGSGGQDAEGGEGGVGVSDGTNTTSAGPGGGGGDAGAFAAGGAGGGIIMLLTKTTTTIKVKTTGIIGNTGGTASDGGNGGPPGGGGGSGNGGDGGAGGSSGGSGAGGSVLVQTIELDLYDGTSLGGGSASGGAPGAGGSGNSPGSAGSSGTAGGSGGKGRIKAFYRIDPISEVYASASADGAGQYTPTDPDGYKESL